MDILEYTKKFSGKKEFIIVLTIALILLLIILSRTDMMTINHPQFEEPNDHHKYIKMATDNPFDFHISPYCWRLMYPSLAKLLPFDLQTNFMILTITFLWLTGVAVFYCMKSYGFDQIFALIGMMFFFSLSWAVKFVLHDFWLMDSLGFLFLVLLFYSIFSKNDKLFVILLILGVTVKESTLFTAPLYYTFNTDKFWNWKLLKKTFIYVLPAVVLFLIIRYFIPALNTDIAYLATLEDKYKMVQDGKSDYNYIDFFLTMAGRRIQSFGLSDISEYTEGPFGIVLVLLPFFAFKKNLQLTLRLLPFILFVYATLFFANNVGRLIVAAFPAILLLATEGIKQIHKKYRINELYLVGFAGLLIVYTLIGRVSFSSLSIKTMLRVIGKLF